MSFYSAGTRVIGVRRCILPECLIKSAPIDFQAFWLFPIIAQRFYQREEWRQDDRAAKEHHVPRDQRIDFTCAADIDLAVVCVRRQEPGCDGGDGAD